MNKDAKRMTTHRNGMKVTISTGDKVMISTEEKVMKRNGAGMNSNIATKVEGCEVDCLEGKELQS